MLSREGGRGTRGLLCGGGEAGERICSGGRVNWGGLRAPEMSDTQSEDWIRNTWRSESLVTSPRMVGEEARLTIRGKESFLRKLF